ncbi:MAG: DUF547 domain-containing protein [Myxococcales bacterium]|nr:DUF547 domain-containing protein [Myxococcales bacterium]
MMRRWSLVVLAVAVVSGGCQTLEKWFGPDQVDIGEAYREQTEGPAFDHGKLEAVLEAVVREDGRVYYDRLAKDTAGLDAYIAELAAADFAALSRDEKLALLINAYNAFTLKLIAEHWPVASIQDIPEDKRWKHARWKIGGLGAVSLDAIEHEYLRVKFAEPRIHFAVNCASEGCPPLRRFAYTGAEIDRQLQDSTVRAHNDPRWLKLKKDAVELTRLYLWFRGDFTQKAGSPVKFAAQFNEALAKRLAEGEIDVEIMEYDWSINAAK